MDCTLPGSSIHGIFQTRVLEWAAIAFSGKENYDQPRQHIQKQRHYFANKCSSSQGYGFSSSHVWMWKLDCEESWTPKNWCFWSVVLEKTLLRVPWTARRSNQSILKVISPWCSLKAETPVLWPPHAKSWKRLWCWEGLGEGGEEDDRGWDICMALLTWWTWFGWTEGVGDGQGGLACCYSWVCKDSDTTEWLNCTELNWSDLPRIDMHSHLTHSLKYEYSELIMSPSDNDHL